MAITEFPPVDLADEYGLLAVGGDLEVESLLLAYSSGIFPWPVFRKNILTWFAPEQRAILKLADLRISKSLRRLRETGRFEFVVDRNCPEVIKRCAASRTRKKPGDTWITSQMRAAYIEFHHAGYCHSVEVYEGNLLVGGLYGVSINGMFAGESMFFEVSGASKLALWRLTEILHEKGVGWIDCQQMSPLLESFGAVEVTRSEFMELLQKALRRPLKLF